MFERPQTGFYARDANVRSPPIANNGSGALPHRMNWRFAVLVLACLGSACASQTSNRAANAGLGNMEQTEPQYPFGGFLFTGPADALENVRRHGESLGLTFSPYPQWPSQPALLISGNAAFGKMKAVMDLVNQSQAGKFGEVRLGLISEPPPP